MAFHSSATWLRSRTTGSALLLQALLLGCGRSNTAPYPATVRVHTEPATASTAAPASSAAGVSLAGTSEAGVPLPKLAPGAPALAEPPSRRVNLNAQPGSSIAQVAQKLGAEFGLNVTVDPEVRGTIAANLKDVTLSEALQEVVRKNGYTYQLQGRMLRVTPLRLNTRIFTLDYVALTRVGTANTVIQRRLSSGTVASPSVGGLSTATTGGNLSSVGGGDVIAATNVSDLWTELRVTLSGMLSRGSGLAAPNGPNGAPGAPASGGTASVAQQGGGLTLGAFAQSWADGTVLTLSPASGLITVTASDDQLAEIETYIEAFQSSVLRQVLIEAKIVEIQLTKSLQFGVDWSVVAKSGKSAFTLSNPATGTTGATGNILFSLTGGSTEINAVLSALSTQGDVNVLQNARTSALNNQRAVFDVTTDEVFFANVRQPITGPTGGVIGFNNQVTAQTISVGIVLDVLPQISSDNILTMNIRPVVTSLDRVETFTASDGTSARFPVTSRREGDTMARVRNGETIIIGGLLQTQRTRNVSGVPILRSIPLLGKLFQHIDETERRVELVVFLTPTVITGQPGAGR
jgi:MSHA biogenesis protein MshL